MLNFRRKEKTEDMLKINKKRALTMFVLTSLITALLSVNMQVMPASAGPAGFLDPDALYLHGPSLTTTHMDCDQLIYGEGLAFPEGTYWHELRPEFCEEWVLTSFEDNENGYLDPCDQIEMTNIHTEELRWYHVDVVTVTMNLSNGFETIYVEYKYPIDPAIEPIYEPFIYEPVCTNWTEVYPVYLGINGLPYHIIDWLDTGEDNQGLLGVCDSIYLVEEDPPYTDLGWWHVEEYTTDLVLNEKIVDPTSTNWHELYPDCGIYDYHLKKWRDGNNGDGLLSPCDYLAMELLPEGPTEDYHVKEVTLTLNLTIEEIWDPEGWYPLDHRMYIEGYYQGVGYEWMWYAKIYPWAFDWFVVCPGEYFDYYLYILNWYDNCNSVLDESDYIELWEGEPYSGQGFICHVDDVAVDIIVEPPCRTVDGYKPPFNDYAPSGMPDFDQKRLEWSGAPEQYTYCGPTAVANSLWWMDSRFEDPNSPPPPEKSDSFRLVTTYGLGWDDHDLPNAPRFIEDLAWYMDTDGQRTEDPHVGTRITDMDRGIRQYLKDRGLQNIFEVVNWTVPDFYDIEYEIERCEDVILLLGFYQNIEGFWQRFGGHYVTAAGVWSDIWEIAFSDPFIDNAEVGGLGRVLPPIHPPHLFDPIVHDNATFISHDTYQVAPGSPSPGGFWWIPDYYIELWWNFAGQNDHPFIEPAPYDPNPIYTVHVEIEYMISISPIPCTEVFPGDATGDGKCNVWDKGLLVDAWQSLVGDENFDPRVDFTSNVAGRFDGKVNVWDKGVIVDQWQKIQPPC